MKGTDCRLLPWEKFAITDIPIISMCNQMVTSEIKEKFPARFVQILII